jgi:hypothetical protein
VPLPGWLLAEARAHCWADGSECEQCEQWAQLLLVQQQVDSLADERFEPQIEPQIERLLS